MKVLLVRLSSLGDVVLTTPLLAALERSGAVVDYLSYQKSEPACGLLPVVRHHLYYPKKQLFYFLKRFRFYSFFSLLRKFLKKLRSEKYDYIIDLHNVTDSAVLSLLAKGEKRVGNRRQVLTVFFTKRCTIEDANDLAQQHAAITNILYGVESALFSSDVVPLIPQLKIVLPVVADTNRIISLRGEAERLIFISPCASYPYKRWPEESFVRLAVELIARFNCRVVLVGDEAGRAVVETVRDAIPHESSLLVGEPIALVVQMLQEGDLFVTNDSALMHLAAAIDIPQVAIFGGANFKKFFPLSSNAYSVCPEGQDALPSARKRRRSQPGDCFVGVTVERVLTACYQALGDQGGCCSCGKGPS